MSRTSPSPAPEVLAEFPLTTTQTRCWVLEKTKPGNVALNVAVRWEVRGPVQASSLETAFRTVIARHEILRTRFTETDTGPVQQVVAEVPFKLDLVDLRAMPEAQQAARVDDIAHEIADRPFDLGQPGLIRATLIRLSPERAMLVYVVHQACFDGASIRVLGHEIGTIAQAVEEGRAPDLPDLPLQYGDYALWQADYLGSGALDEDALWWDETLAGAPYFEVEPDKPRPPVRSTACAQILRALPADFDAKLTGAARTAGLSPFAYGCAVFSAVLARATGAGEVLFGTQIAGRLDSALDPLIGVFINNLVLRFPTGTDTPLAAHLGRAKQVVEGALMHQAMPFNQLVERLNPPRDPGRTPLISVNFNLQHVFMQSRAYGGFELVSSPSHAPGAVYDLDFAVMGRPGGWQIMAEYVPDMFAPETIEALIDLLADAFAASFDAPDTPIGALPLPEALAQRQARAQDDTHRVADALAAHPMVAEAATVRDTAGLHGFVTPGATGLMPLDELPATLMAHARGAGLAPPLTGITVLGGFPRTATGAINRALLRPPARRDTAAADAEPDAALMADLTRWWAEVLSLDTVPPGADFFDLGGHSVLVLRLLTRIRAGLGVDLDITAVYEAPTPERLARRIAAVRASVPGPRETADWRIMRLKRDGTRHPLVAINNAATAQALTALPGADRPVTCIRAVEAGKGLTLTDERFEDVARHYAEILRAAQPEGPYLLYGNCVHGNLALETARLLHADGATITGVVMKDVWEPGFVARLAADPALARREKLHALANRLGMLRRGEISLTAFLGYYRAARKLGLVTLAARLTGAATDQVTDLEADQERFIRHLSALRDAYRPAPVPFPVLHVVTPITPSGGGFPDSIGWEDIVPADTLTTRRTGRITIERTRREGVATLEAAIAAFADGSA